jgi:hypothetical protein
MDASKARNEGLVKSSLRSHASRNDGSWGNGHSGWMYMKKSSISAFTVGSGQMVSADSCCGCDDCNCARACAALVGDCGDDWPECGSVWFRRRFLMSSACLLGGPRRRLGRSKVHGISRDMHARHGGPVSSHCMRSVQRALIAHEHDKTHLDFADAARVASFAQPVRLLRRRRLRQRRQRVWDGHALVVQGMVGVQGVRLQHVEVLNLGVRRLLRIRPARRSLVVVKLGIGIGRRWIDGRVMRVTRRGWIRIRHDGLQLWMFSRI